LTGRLAGRARLPRQALTASAATVAVAAGLAVGWAAGWTGGWAGGWTAGGRTVAVGGLAVLVAAANGFAKAYSP